MSTFPSSIPFVSRNYTNGAPVTLVYEIGFSTDTLVVNAPIGWPDPPFWVVVDRSTLSQEVMEVTASATSGSDVSLTVTRAADGNGPFTHGVGAGVELSGVARDWAEMSAHMTDTERDDHPRLMGSDGSGHDLINRHSLGVSIATGTPTVSSLGDLAEQGVGPGLARADHVHGSGFALGDLLPAFLPPGTIVAIDAAQVTYPDPLPPQFLWCDGSWYPKDLYLTLSTMYGNSYPPFTDLQTTAGLPGGVASRYSTAYDPIDYFAVPCLLYWTVGATSPQWYWSPAGTPLPLGWAVYAGDITNP